MGSAAHKGMFFQYLFDQARPITAGRANSDQTPFSNGRAALGGKVIFRG